MIFCSFVIFCWVPGWNVMSMEINHEGSSNKDINSDPDLLIQGKTKEDDVTGLIDLIRNQPKQEKKEFLEMILRPELDNKQRIIETMVQESGNQFLIKNIRCLKRLYKYGTNQLLGMGVEILFSDVAQDKKRLKLLTNVLENLSGDPTPRHTPEDSDQKEEADIEIMENLTDMERARFTSSIIPHIRQNELRMGSRAVQVPVYAGASRRRGDFNQFYRRYHHGSRPLALLPRPQYYRYPFML